MGEEREEGEEREVTGSSQIRVARCQPQIC